MLALIVGLAIVALFAVALGTGVALLAVSAGKRADAAFASDSARAAIHRQAAPRLLSAPALPRR